MAAECYPRSDWPGCEHSNGRSRGLLSVTDANQTEMVPGALQIPDPPLTIYWTLTLPIPPAAPTHRVWWTLRSSFA